MQDHLCGLTRATPDGTVWLVATLPVASSEQLDRIARGLDKFGEWSARLPWRLRYEFDGNGQAMIRVHGSGGMTTLHATHRRAHDPIGTARVHTMCTSPTTHGDPFQPHRVTQYLFKTFVYGRWSYEVAACRSAPNRSSIGTAATTYQVRLYTDDVCGLRHTLGATGAFAALKRKLARLEASREVRPHDPAAHFGADQQKVESHGNQDPNGRA